MQLSEIYQNHRRVISFELYPPTKPEAEAVLFEREVPRLIELEPAYMTCTYGAGGSTRDKTLEVVTRLRHEFGVPTAAHLTCVGASRDEIAAYLERIRQAGITNLVALRGDPPRGEKTFVPHPRGFRYATELVRFINQLGGFDVAVAGYPEAHPECPDKFLDWLRCRDKVEAGGDVIITQLFYDTRDFYEFREHLTKILKVNVPVVPGVLPISNTAQIKRFCGMCGSRLPPRVLERLDKYVDDPESCRQYGVELATEMSEELLREGAPGLHFYVLNRARSIVQIMNNLTSDSMTAEPPAS